MIKGGDESVQSFDDIVLCPYSEETVTGCRNYLPVSQHGGFPGAARCRFALRLLTSEYIRHTLCRCRIGETTECSRRCA
jgi:hypothetical protein